MNYQKPRETMKRAGRKQATQRGHTMRAWSKVPGLLHGEEHIAECASCFAMAIVQVNSSNTEAKLTGSACRLPCQTTHVSYRVEGSAQ